MAFWSRTESGVAATGVEGVAIRVRSHNQARVRRSGRLVPWFLVLSILAASAFYLLAHAAIISGVWPVHGTSPQASQTVFRDIAALAGWLGVLATMRYMGYRGAWGVVILPIVIFCLTRPVQFGIFTDPVYQAKGRSRAEANELKARRAHLTTAERAYTEGREEMVFGGETPAPPDPWQQATGGATSTRGGSQNPILRLIGLWSVLLAPLALLAGFLVGRNRGLIRTLRDRRAIPFVGVMIVFGGLAFVSQLGKVAGTTPWELFLPFFVFVWAATLADDAYNLARPGEALQPQRLAKLFLYGALPLIPFLILHELGL